MVDNVVTPNEDGKKERFYVENLEYYPGSQLQVFNRWGQKVYEHPGYDNSWVPAELEAGSYYYNLTPPDKPIMTGMFRLLR